MPNMSPGCTTGWRVTMDEITRDLGVSTEDLPVEEVTPLDELVRKEGREMMDNLIGWMPDRRALIWRDRHVTPGSPTPYRTMGRHLGLSGERVRQIYNKALHQVERAFALDGWDGVGREWLRGRQADSRWRYAQRRSGYRPPASPIRTVARRRGWVSRASLWSTPWADVADAAWMAETGYTHPQIQHRQGWGRQQTRYRLILARSRMVTRLEGGLCNLIQRRKENGETDQT